MADQKNVRDALNTYNLLCEALDEHEFKYEKHADDLVITFGMSGEDIPMQFVVMIDAERSLIRIFSPIPATFGEDKRIEGAIATCQVNYKLSFGSFDYDIKKGTVSFRMVSSYKDSLLSKDMFMYMIAFANFNVDKYNDKFFMLAKGMMTIEDFMKWLS